MQPSWRYALLLLCLVPSRLLLLCHIVSGACCIATAVVDRCTVSYCFGVNSSTITTTTTKLLEPACMGAGCFLHFTAAQLLGNTNLIEVRLYIQVRIEFALLKVTHAPCFMATKESVHLTMDTPILLPASLLCVLCFLSHVVLLCLVL